MTMIEADTALLDHNSPLHNSQSELGNSGDSMAVGCNEPNSSSSDCASPTDDCQTEFGSPGG